MIRRFIPEKTGRLFPKPVIDFRHPLAIQCDKPATQTMRKSYFLAAVVFASSGSLSLRAAEAQIESIQILSNKLEVIVRPDDQTGVLRILTSTNLSQPWVTNTATTTPGTNSTLVGQVWTTNTPPGQFFFVRAVL